MQAAAQIYLDNNATTRMDPAVLAAMMPFLTEHYANPSAQHGAGGVAAEAVRTARQQVRALIGAAHERDIIFTSGGTEADNTAICSALAAQPGRDEVIVSAVEHAAVLTLCGWLERHTETRVHRIGVDGRGRLDMDAYRAALGPRTAIVSMMWANNETGTIFPVAELAAMAHAAGALFHTDAVQAAGKVPIDVNATSVDMLSLSAHKFHGPKGVGALFVRSGMKFQPLILGGKQERGRRGGTENVPGIVGMGCAAAVAHSLAQAESGAMAALRDRLEQGILRHVPDCAVAGDTVCRLPNTSAILCDGAEAEAILSGLDAAGVAASSGAACSSGAMQASHVLRAMAVPASAAFGAVRFSLSRYSTADDIDRVVEVLPRIVARARAVAVHAHGPRALSEVCA